MRRFFAPKIPALHAQFSLPEAEARHFATVLRGKPGDSIKILDGDGTIALCQVLEIAGSRKKPDVIVQVDSYETTLPGGPQICLFVACPRTRQMELILRQATELGVAEIFPIITEFTVSKPNEAPDKWQHILIEAVKQSGNPFLPKLHPVMTFDQALSVDCCPQIGYYGAVPVTGEEGVCHKKFVNLERVALWIGPEGGFSGVELEALRNKTCQDLETDEVSRSFLPLTIGHHILRIETACTAGIALLTSSV